MRDNILNQEPNDLAANKKNFLKIMGDVLEGTIQFPEFQRSFIWKKDNIKDLLISLLKGYFIGTFLFLSSSSDKPIFKSKVVQGLESIKEYHINTNRNIELVLDGQQRITSLFYAIFEPDIALKDTKNPYKFFFSLENALLDDSLEEAIKVINVNDKKSMDLMMKKISEGSVIPFNLLCNNGKFYKWLSNQVFLKSEEERNIIESFQQNLFNFHVPVITLDKNTPIDSIVNIFERINRTGIQLSTFDLAVARLYLNDIKLRDLSIKFYETIQDDFKEVVKHDHLIKLISLINDKEIKKGQVLDYLVTIPKNDFEIYWKDITKYINKAIDRMKSPKMYAAIDAKWLPYQTQVIPLAALIKFVDQNDYGAKGYSKIDKWYWITVFTSRYDEGTDSKTYKDYMDLKKWITDDSKIPDFIKNLNIETIDMNVESTRSAIYKGIICLIIKKGALDFADGQPAELHQCQDDHIFPYSKYKTNPLINIIFNKTLISKKTNEHRKNNLMPSKYLPLFKQLHENTNGKELLNTLQTHIITERSYDSLVNDNFEAFIEHRKKDILQEIKKLLH